MHRWACAQKLRSCWVEGTVWARQELLLVSHPDKLCAALRGSCGGLG